jgi:hypothetical protein
VICINKKINDIMFLNIITLLEKKYSKRLKIINFITQEHNLKNYSLKINKGRPSIKNIKKEITSKKNMIMYVCGPSSVRENKKTNKLSIIRFTNFVKKIVEKSISIKKNKFKLKNESY